MHTKQPTTKSRTELRTAAPPVSREIGLGFEWFLELPVQVVLLVLWVAGIVFFGAWSLLSRPRPFSLLYSPKCVE
jgi:hypothetical protein